MSGKRKNGQRNCFEMVFALAKVKTEQKKGRDKTMLQKKTEYWQKVNNE